MRHSTTISGERPLSPWRISATALAVAIYTAMSACAAPDPTPAAQPVAPGALSLKGAGSTFSAPLLKRWITTYGQSHPSVAITYDPVGSGEGVRRFIGRDVKDADRVDFGASDFAMSNAQLDDVNNDALMIPVTGASVALAYHVSPLRNELRLSRRAYAGIFLGTVTHWNDPLIRATNPGITLPDEAIGLAVREDSSGTTFALSQHLASISDAWRRQFQPSPTVGWRGEAMRAKGNDGVAGLVKSFNGMIGYVGFEFATQLSLDVAALENHDGQFVGPSAESCRAGLAAANIPEDLRAFVPDPGGKDAYPIVTYSWLLVRKSTIDSSNGQALKDFLKWCLTDGQATASETGYVPLPSSMVQKSLAALKTPGLTSSR